MGLIQMIARGVIAGLALWVVVNLAVPIASITLFGSAAVGLLFPSSRWPVPVLPFITVGAAAGAIAAFVVECHKRVVVR